MKYVDSKKRLYELVKKMTQKPEKIPKPKHGYLSSIKI